MMRLTTCVLLAVYATFGSAQENGVDFDNPGVCFSKLFSLKWFSFVKIIHFRTADLKRATGSRVLSVR